MSEPQKKKICCSYCHQEGHNIRGCAQRKASVQNQNQNPSQSQSQNQQPNKSKKSNRTVAPILTTQQLSNLSYALIDIESLGFGITNNKIIQFAAMFLNPNGEKIGREILHNINPLCPIPQRSTQVHGLTNDKLKDELSMEFVSSIILDDLESNLGNQETALVTHNASSLDVPLLIAELDRFGKQLPENIKYVIDTRRLAEMVLKNQNPSPDNFQLQTLYKFISKQDMINAHNALADVKAMKDILLEKNIWNARINKIQPVKPFIDRNEERKKKQVSEVSGEDSEDEGDLVCDIDDEEVDDQESTGVENSQVVAWLPPPEDYNPETPFHGPPSGPRDPKSCKTPLNAFLYLWKGVELFIVKETNKYAEFTMAMDKLNHVRSWIKNRNEKPFKKLVQRKWIPLTIEELRKFLAILLLSGIHGRHSNLEEWWSKDPFINFPAVQSIMTGQRFMQILRFIHISDKLKQPLRSDPNFDKLYKVRKFQEQLVEKFKSAYHLPQNVSIDEIMVAFKGRTSLKQYIANKPIKRGFRIWAVACAETGYVSNFEIYSGAEIRENNDEFGLGERVVKKNTQFLLHKGHIVSMDRFFTTPKIAEYLHINGTYCCGTVNPNRSGMPKNLNLPPRSQRGSCKSLYKAPLLAVSWMDSKQVTFLSTCSKSKSAEELIARRRSGGRVLEFFKPPIVNDYNKGMGGVDFADQMRSYCNVQLVGLKRWWLPLFFFFFDQAVENARVLFDKSTFQKTPTRSFRLQLVRQLVEAIEVNQQKDATTGHTPSYFEKEEEGRRRKRRRCVYCSEERGEEGRSSLWCQVCGVVLCVPECFQKYHQKMCKSVKK